MAKKGDIVGVTFLDHVESGHEAKPIKFAVFGRLVSEDKRSVCVGSWVYANPRRRMQDGNTTTFTILKSCIEKFVVYEPREE